MSTLRQWFRTFQKRPLFSTAVIAILGLGVGATTAVFSVVNGVLLSPLPFPTADRLVRISKNDIQRGWSHYPILYRELALWREASENLTEMAALPYTGASDAAVTIDGARRALKELDVTTNYFDVLGVQPFLGRTFLTEDEDIGDAPSVVLSYRTWQNLFASDAASSGRGFRFREAVATASSVFSLRESIIPRAWTCTCPRSRSAPGETSRPSNRRLSLGSRRTPPSRTPARSSAPSVRD